MLDALTLDQMRTFVAVAETGSFRAASARLSRVQSAVSHAIANLEDQLGVALFARTGRRPALTPAGQTLLAQARAILLKVDAMRAQARGLHQGVEVRLSIALDPQFPLDLAAAALGEMNAAFPAVCVRVLTASLGEGIAALKDRRCTLAISGIELPDLAIEREALWYQPRAAVVAPSHPLAARAAAGGPVPTAELAEHLQIVGEDPSALTQGRDFGVLSPGTWRVSDNATKHALILAGVGWGSLPLWLIARDLAEGRLVRVPASEFGPAGETVLRTYLMHRVDQPLGPAARAFRQALLDRVGAEDGNALARRREPMGEGGDPPCAAPRGG